MSILSWDDFEDDSQKPAAPEQQPTPVEPKKTANPQMVSDASNTSSNVAAAQPAAAPRSAGSNSTDSLARASASLDQLDVAPGLEELEMGAQRVQVDDKLPRRLEPVSAIQIRMGLAEISGWLCEPLDASRNQHEPRHRIVEV